MSKMIDRQTASVSPLLLLLALPARAAALASKSKGGNTRSSLTRVSNEGSSAETRERTRSLLLGSPSPIAASLLPAAEGRPIASSARIARSPSSEEKSGSRSTSPAPGLAEGSRASRGARQAAATGSHPPLASPVEERPPSEEARARTAETCARGSPLAEGNSGARFTDSREAARAPNEKTSVAVVRGVEASTSSGEA